MKAVDPTNYIAVREELKAYMMYLEGGKPKGRTFLPYLCVMGNMPLYSDLYPVRSHFSQWLTSLGKKHILSDDGDIVLEKGAYDKSMFYVSTIPKEHFIMEDNILKKKEDRLSFCTFVYNLIFNETTPVVED